MKESQARAAGQDRPRHGWRGRSLHGRIHGVPGRGKSSAARRLRAPTL